MKVPNGEHAIVDLSKLTDYSLSPEHERGMHKARVFAAALGVTVEQAPELRNILLKLVVEADAKPGLSNSYGDRYIIDFEWSHKKRTARIRSCWIIRTNETVPRLTSCFVL